MTMSLVVNIGLVDGDCLRDSVWHVIRSVSEATVGMDEWRG